MPDWMEIIQATEYFINSNIQPKNSLGLAQK